MPPAKSQLTKDRYIRASNIQAKSQMLSVLSSKIKWKSRSGTQRTALISKGKRVIEGNRFEPSTAWPCTRRPLNFQLCKLLILKDWSGRKDLNLRPPGPEPGALARLRYAPNLIPYFPTVYAGLRASATIRDWKQKQSRRAASAPRRLLKVVIWTQNS